MDKQLEEAKKKCSESSSELSSLRKDNTSAEKRIADLEKQTRKLNDENKKLIADLEDEKAKVMALAEIREEDDLDMAPLPRKKSRRSSGKVVKAPEVKTPAKTPAKAPAKTPAKKKQTPKSKSTSAAAENFQDEDVVSSVSKRGRQSKKVAYEELDIPLVEQDDEDPVEFPEEDPEPPKPKKGRGKKKIEEDPQAAKEPVKVSEVADMLLPPTPSSASKKGKTGKKDKTETTPSKVANSKAKKVVEPPVIAPVTAPKGKSKGKNSKAAPEPEPEPEAKNQPEPQTKVKGKGNNSKPTAAKQKTVPEPVVETQPEAPKEKSTKGQC